MRHTTIESTVYSLLSWQDLVELTDDLAQQVLQTSVNAETAPNRLTDHNAKSLDAFTETNIGPQHTLDAYLLPYDRIIAVANGGLTMARHFGDRIGLRKISLLQTAYYATIGQTTHEPELLQAPAISIEGERILVFEDIVDTGVTLQFVSKVLKEQYGAAVVDVASLLVKSWAAVKPRYVARELDSWVIYPYETRESIEALALRWSEAGIQRDEIWQRLARIGFAPSDIDQYLHLSTRSRIE